jgi:hypothetical protein
MIKQGFIHCLGVMLLTMTVYFATLKVFDFEKSNAEALAGLIYMLAVGVLGYIWKLKNGRTYSLLDSDGNKKLIHYAFGAAIVLVGMVLLASIKFIVSVGPWWPFILLLLVPIGLFAQTVNFTILVMAGGFFCRK